VGARAAGTYGGPKAALSQEPGAVVLIMTVALGPPRERMQTRGWGQYPFPTQPFCVFMCWDSDEVVQHG
jgi:hypothetical protein